MQGGYFSYGLLATLAIALLVAAFTDLRRRQIDNWLTIAIAIAAPLYWLSSGISLADAGFRLLAALITFALLAALFAMRAMGGGDVKLLAALALWFPPLTFFELCFMMAIVGGAMSMFAGVRNLALDPGQRLTRTVAQSSTAIWLIGSAYVVYVINGGRALNLGKLAGAVSPDWLGTSLLVAALASIFILMVSGSVVISRFQRSRLPIPYGLAISIAGLWVLSTRYFPAFSQASLHAGT